MVDKVGYIRRTDYVLGALVIHSNKEGQGINIVR